MAGIVSLAACYGESSPDDSLDSDQQLAATERMSAVVVAIAEPETVARRNGSGAVTTQAYSIADATGATFAEFEALACLDGCKGNTPRTVIGADVAVGSTVTIVGAFRKQRGKLIPELVAQSIVTDTVGDDTTPPMTPSALSAEALSPTEVLVSWSPTSDEDGGSGLRGYRVFRDGALVVEVKAGTTELVDSGLAPETGYEYAVSAVDNSGNESAATPAVSVTTPAAGPTLDGAALYAEYCQACHGPLASSEKRGATATMIENARSKGVHAGWAGALTSEQVAAIAEALR
jgi:chitinase